MTRARVLLAGLALMLPAAALAEEATGPSTIWLSLKDRKQLSRVQAEIDSGAGKPARKAVTDLIVAVERQDDKISEQMRAKDGEVIGKSVDAFNAKVYVVAGGRLYIDAFGLCKAFTGDVSVCGVECDGGQFALRREVLAEGYRLTLITGDLTKLGGTGTHGFRIGECGGDASVSLVASKKGGTGEIVLEGN